MPNPATFAMFFAAFTLLIVIYQQLKLISQTLLGMAYGYNEDSEKWQAWEQKIASEQRFSEKIGALSLLCFLGSLAWWAVIVIYGFLR